MFLKDTQVIKQNCLLNGLSHRHILCSVVDKATLECKVDLQLTGPLARLNKYLIVERLLSKLPAKLESTCLID